MDLILIGLGLIVLVGLLAYISISTSPLNKSEYRKLWQKVEQTARTKEVGLRLAIIDADKLVDKAMKQLGIKGENMGDRLVNAKSRFTNYEQLWQAHKLRNRLVHEEVKLKNSEAARALGAFRKSLKNLGAL